MLSQDEHDRLIAGLYASAMGDLRWESALKQLADAFGATASLNQVSALDSVPLSVVNHGYSAEFQASYYASEAYANDPRVSYYRTVRPGSVYCDRSLYDVEEMDRNPWCQQSYDVLGVKYQLGAVLRLPNQTMSAITLLRSPAEGHASREEIEAYHRLAPHMQQACALGHLIERQAVTQALLLEALSRRADGVMMLDADGAVAFMNDAAAAMLSTADGLIFAAGEFTARKAAETRRLQGMVHGVLNGARGGPRGNGGQMLVSRPSGLKPYVIQVMGPPPVERFLTARTAACVIHLQDLAAERVPSRQSLSMVFGLSEREADLAVELVRCSNLASAAARAGMSVNTARNHLQSIFRKSGASSQTEAVQLFGRLN